MNLDELERRANDPARLDEEVQRASEQTVQAEARNEVGVYVYALPHYIRYPYDPASGRYTTAVMNLIRAGGVATALSLGLFVTVMWRRDRKAA